MLQHVRQCSILDERLKREKEKLAEERNRVQKELQRERNKYEEELRGLDEDKNALAMIKVQTMPHELKWFL